MDRGGNLCETRVNVMTMFKEKFRRLARYNNTSHCCPRLRTTVETPAGAGAAGARVEREGVREK